MRNATKILEEEDMRFKEAEMVSIKGDPEWANKQMEAVGDANASTRQVEITLKLHNMHMEAKGRRESSRANREKLEKYKKNSTGGFWE